MSLRNARCNDKDNSLFIYLFIDSLFIYAFHKSDYRKWNDNVGSGQIWCNAPCFAWEN